MSQITVLPKLFII